MNRASLNSEFYQSDRWNMTGTSSSRRQNVHTPQIVHEEPEQRMSGPRQGQIMFEEEHSSSNPRRWSQNYGQYQRSPSPFNSDNEYPMERQERQERQERPERRSLQRSISMAPGTQSEERLKRTNSVYRKNVETVYGDQYNFNFVDVSNPSLELRVHVIPQFGSKTFVRFNNHGIFDIVDLTSIHHIEDPTNMGSGSGHYHKACLTIFFEHKDKMVIENCTAELFSEAMVKLTPFVNKTARHLIDTDTIISYYGNNEKTTVPPIQSLTTSTNAKDNSFLHQQKIPVEQVQKIHSRNASSSKDKKKKTTKSKTEDTSQKTKKTSLWKRFRSSF